MLSAEELHVLRDQFVTFQSDFQQRTALLEPIQEPSQVFCRNKSGVISIPLQHPQTDSSVNFQQFFSDSNIRSKSGTVDHVDRVANLQNNDHAAKTVITLPVDGRAAPAPCTTVATPTSALNAKHPPSPRVVKTVPEIVPCERTATPASASNAEHPTS